MSRDSYMPSKQADQVAWAQNFLTVVQGSLAAYGVSATLMTQFEALTNTLQEAWTAASNVSTRTRGNVAAKDDALRNMKAAARNLVSIIQGTPSVTDQMRLAAGVTVRSTGRTPTPVPAMYPWVGATGTGPDGRTLVVELRQDKSKRGRPAKVAGATIYTATGPVAPTTADGWRVAANATKTTVAIPFPPSATGDTVWVTASWTNSLQQSGPAARPVSVNLPAGGELPQRAEAQPTTKMRAAA